LGELKTDGFSKGEEKEAWHPSVRLETASVMFANKSLCVRRKSLLLLLLLLSSSSLLIEEMDSDCDNTEMTRAGREPLQQRVGFV
jgi:hypothetical protein